MRVLIVGAGEIGRWFAGVCEGWLSVTFTDVDERAAESAATATNAEHVLPEDITPVSVVCTAVPLRETPRVIARYAQYAETAMIDVSGSMREPLDAMGESTDSIERISIHPLFAPENAPGNVAIVSADEGPVGATLQQRLEARGNTTFETTPEAHDRAMETVQAKAHAALLAYALAADSVDERFHTPISAGLTDLVSTVLDGTPRVYADIQAQFPGAEEIAREADRIAHADPTTFESLYRQAADRLADE